LGLKVSFPPDKGMDYGNASNLIVKFSSFIDPPEEASVKPVILQPALRLPGIFLI
jgi:hypothetical protein